MATHQKKSVQSHHDVICIGFNTSAISLAIKLREISPQTNVLYLERECTESWKPNGDLPGHMHMHTNFLNDLVTLQNPRSSFTFVNFLHKKKLLVEFTNLGAMEPSRGLFEDYVSWCAEPFQSNVKYGQKVLSIEPVHSAEKKVSEWNVFTTDEKTGDRRIATASKVVLCLNKEPAVPSFLSARGIRSHVVEAAHSTSPLHELMLPEKENVAIAIVGQSHEAAELFDFLYDARADREVVWFNAATSASTETSNQRYVILYGCMSQAYTCFSLPAITDERYPPELRVTASIDTMPSISSKLAERLDEIEYSQSVKQPDKQLWRYRTEPTTKIQSAILTEKNRVELAGINKLSNEHWKHEFDLVITANGHSRQSPRPILDSVVSTRLLDGPALTSNANYHVNLRRGITEQNVGLWCIGLFGQPEIAVGEASLTVTAERSARVANDIISRSTTKRSNSPSRGKTNVQAQL